MHDIVLTFRTVRHSRPISPQELVDITVFLRRRNEDAGTIHIPYLSALPATIFARVPASFGKLSAHTDAAKLPSLIVEADYLRSGEYCVLRDGKELLYSYDALSGLWRLPGCIYKTALDLEHEQVQICRQTRDDQKKYGYES